MDIPLKTYEQRLQERTETRAKQLSWESLSEKEQKSFLRRAKKIERTKMTEETLKFWEENVKPFDLNHVK